MLAPSWLPKAIPTGHRLATSTRKVPVEAVAQVFRLIPHLAECPGGGHGSEPAPKAGVVLMGGKTNTTGSATKARGWGWEGETNKTGSPSWGGLVVSTWRFHSQPKDKVHLKKKKKKKKKKIRPEGQPWCEGYGCKTSRAVSLVAACLDCLLT